MQSLGQSVVNYNIVKVFSINENNPNVGNLFIGTQAGAKDFLNLKRNGIKCILNVANDVTIKYPKHELILCKKVNLVEYENSKKSEISTVQQSEKLVIESQEFISKNINNYNILVHCYAGINRSAAIISLYLTIYQQKSFNQVGESPLDEAIKFVKEKRPQIAIDNFYKEIIIKISKNMIHKNN